MKKICPYCKRVGELGEVCQGCGYILSVNDETVSEADSTSQPDHTQTTFSQTTYTETKDQGSQSRTTKSQTKTTTSQAQGAEPFIGEDQMGDLTKQVQTLFNSIQSQMTQTGSSAFQVKSAQAPTPQTAPKPQNPAVKRSLSIFGWIMSSIFIIIGLVLFSFMFTITDSEIPPVVFGGLAGYFILWGLLTLSFTQQWCKKFRKYIVYLFLAGIAILLLLAAYS